MTEDERNKKDGLISKEEFLTWLRERKTFNWRCPCGEQTKAPIQSPFKENKGEPMCGDCFEKYCRERRKNNG